MQSMAEGVAIRYDDRRGLICDLGKALAPDDYARNEGKHLVWEVVTCTAFMSYLSTKRTRYACNLLTIF